MTRLITADVLGFEGEEAASFEALPSREGEFSLSKNLGIWEQWVSELSRGALWVPEELESACSIRDSLDEQLAALPDSLTERVFAFVDELDQRFRDWTVTSTFNAEGRTDAHWWWGRVPIRNPQRLFLFNLHTPSRYLARFPQRRRSL